VIGIDVGIRRLLATSDGQAIGEDWRQNLGAGPSAPPLMQRQVARVHRPRPPFLALPAMAQGASGQWRECASTCWCWVFCAEAG